MDKKQSKYSFALSQEGLSHCKLVYAMLLLFGHVQLFVTPWTAAWQASLSFTISQSFLKLISIELVMLSNHLILYCPFLLCLQSLPASGSFPMSQLFASGGQSVRVSISASVLTMNIQSWFPLGLTSLTFFQSKGLSRVFPSTIIWRHQFFGAQPSLWSKFYIHTWLLEKPLLWLYRFLTSLLFNMLSRFVIAFLSRSKQVYAIGLSIF